MATVTDNQVVNERSRKTRKDSVASLLNIDVFAHRRRESKTNRVGNLSLCEQLFHYWDEINKKYGVVQSSDLGPQNLLGTLGKQCFVLGFIPGETTVEIIKIGQLPEATVGTEANRGEMQDPAILLSWLDKLVRECRQLQQPVFQTGSFPYGQDGVTHACAVVPLSDDDGTVVSALSVIERIDFKNEQDR